MNYTEEMLKGIIEWDIETWKKCIKFFDQNISFTSDMKCLEIGGRRGGMSLWLALNGCRDILCTDYFDNTEIAFKNHKNFKIDFIKYNKLDVTNIDVKNKYDLIVFKSVLGGVGYNDNKTNQEKAIQEMYNALKPGGKLLFAENLTASKLHSFCRKRFIPWGNKWRYVTVKEISEMTSQFKNKKYRCYGFFSAFGRNEFQRKILGKLDNVLDKFIPDKSKYIIFAVLEK